MSSARPKRPSLASAYPGLDDAQAPSSSGRPAKKPRFDVRNPSRLAAGSSDDDDDGDDDDYSVRRNGSGYGCGRGHGHGHGHGVDDVDYLEADSIGRRGRRVKRTAVNVEGYESDSENDESNARAERLAREKRRLEKQGRKDGDDAEEDMFAADEEELAEDFGLGPAEGSDEDGGGKKGKKQVRFMNAEDIEGQEAQSRGGHSVHVDFRSAATSSAGDEAAGAVDKGKATFARDSAASDSDSDSGSDSGSDDVDDETRAALDSTVDAELGAGGKKQHAPLLDAFNMRAEQQEGRFDEAGNYVRNAADPDAAYDSWLDGVSRRDVRRAKAAHARREEERRREAREADRTLTSELLAALIRWLERGETPLEALARLHRQGKTRAAAAKRGRRLGTSRRKVEAGSHPPDAEMKDARPEDDAAEAARKQAIDAITTASDTLLARGHTDIYEREREMLTRQYRRETGEEWQDEQPPDQGRETALATAAGAATDTHADTGTGTGTPAPSGSATGTDTDTDAWEFRWSDARDGGGVHGPYDEATMRQWQAAGYFGEGVAFRKAGGDEWIAALPFA